MWVLKAAALAGEWVDAMRSEAFVLEAHHTTHIEGTRLTLEHAAKILSTFPIVQRQDQAAFNTYRTRNLILACMNALQAGDTKTVDRSLGKGKLPQGSGRRIGFQQFLVGLSGR